MGLRKQCGWLRSVRMLACEPTPYREAYQEHYRGAYREPCREPRRETLRCGAALPRLLRLNPKPETLNPAGLLRARCRWGQTPLQESIAEQHTSVHDVLVAAKAKLLYMDATTKILAASKADDMYTIKK